jgi:transposase
MEESLAHSIEQISQADWERTPLSVRQVLEALTQRVNQLDTEQQQWRGAYELLQEQVKLNSTNSSQPPSKDRVKGFKPNGNELNGEDREPFRTQVVEIPPVVSQIIEHRVHALVCEQCQAVSRADCPEVYCQPGYGERVVAHVALLSGVYRQSHRLVQKMLKECFGVEMGLGTVQRLRQGVSSYRMGRCSTRYHSAQTPQNRGSNSRHLSSGRDSLQQRLAQSIPVPSDLSTIAAITASRVAESINSSP